jgi:hypothetical protein
MAISLKHAFESAVPDGGDASLVRPSNWNAEHILLVATGILLGRATAGDGAAEELTPAQVRTLLNVEDGAAADMSAAEILAALLTVDGTGSALDADLLDGNEASAFPLLNGDGGIDLSTNDGIDVNPGSDIDADLLTVGVTGTPTFSWDESSNQFRSTHGLIIGATGDGAHTIAGVSIVSNFEIHSEGGTDPGGLSVHRHSDSQVLGGHALFLKSRGTHASPTVVADNDILAWLDGLGHDGTDYESAAAIQFLIDGTPGNNDMPGEIAFFTNAGSQTLTRRISIRADGSVEIVTGPLTLPNTGLHLLDTNASHDLIIAPGSDLSADRTLTLTTGDADRTLTLGGDTTLSGGTHSGTNTGDEATASEGTEGVVDQATDAEIRAATSGAHAIMAEDLQTANALVTLTDDTTVAVDWTAGINFTLTLTTDRILGNPTNEIPGTFRMVFVISDGGPDELTFGSEYGGTPPTLDDITTTKGYLLTIFCRAVGQFIVTAVDGSPA